MLSAAGTPSTDPWVILARERLRYEEQFRSLKPSNGIITGEQAKGFFLQSQLPPLVLGQIWALADTDSDGKMDINEFSIACKLINLKLRGFDVPKGLPPSLLASLKLHSTATPPAIPPLPNPALVSHPPARPDPPKMGPANSVSQKPSYIPSNQPLIGTAQPMISTSQPMLNNAQSMIITRPVSTSQPLIGATQSMMSGIQPLVNTSQQPVISTGQPLVPGLSGFGSGTIGTGIPPTGVVQPVNMMGGAVSNTGNIIPTGIVPPMPPVQTLVGGQPYSPSAPHTVQPVVSQPLAGFGSQPPLIPNLSGISQVPVAPLVTTVSSSSLVNTGQLSPVGSISSVGAIAPPLAGPGATSTPRASVTSLDRANSVESGSGPEWAVPHQTKLKYTQIFNTMDRTRTGYLSGAQARNVMVQTKLPQAALAQIW